MTKLYKYSLEIHLEIHSGSYLVRASSTLENLIYLLNLNRRPSTSKRLVANDSAQNAVPEPVFALLVIASLLQQTPGSALHLELVLSNVHQGIDFHLLQALWPRLVDRAVLG